MSDRERPSIEEIERGGKPGDPLNTDIVDRLRILAKSVRSEYARIGKFYFSAADNPSDEDLQYFAMVDAVEVIEHYRKQLAEARSERDEAVRQLLEEQDQLSEERAKSKAYNTLALELAQELASRCADPLHAQQVERLEAERASDD